MERLFADCRTLLRSTGRGCGDRELAGFHAGLVEAFTLAIESTQDAPPRPTTLRNRIRLAHRAERWMRAHLGETFHVPDLCAAMRVSRRELEYAFRTVSDQSPRQRVKTLRLHAIRRELRLTAGDCETVIRIAYGQGVTHLGRFAASYRRLFGESPAETLRRRKGGG